MPYVWVGQVTALKNWHTLTPVPLLIVTSTDEEIVEMIQIWGKLEVNIALNASGGGTPVSHPLTELLPSGEIVELPHDTLLYNIL